MIILIKAELKIMEMNHQSGNTILIVMAIIIIIKEDITKRNNHLLQIEVKVGVPDAKIMDGVVKNTILNILTNK